MITMKFDILAMLYFLNDFPHMRIITQFTVIDIPGKYQIAMKQNNNSAHIVTNCIMIYNLKQ